MPQSPTSREEKESNGGKRLYLLVRGYVLLVLGVGLVIYGLIAELPAVLTLGGGIVALQPAIRAAT